MQALQKPQAAAPRDMLKPGRPGMAGQGAMSDTQPQQSASQPCHLHSLPLQSPSQSLNASKGYDQDFFGLHLQNVVRNVSTFLRRVTKLKCTADGTT